MTSQKRDLDARFGRVKQTHPWLCLFHPRSRRTRPHERILLDLNLKCIAHKLP